MMTTHDEDDGHPDDLTGMENNISNVFEEFICGRKIGPIQKAAINHSATKDIIAMGNNKLKNRNLVPSRLRKKAGDQRRQKQLEKQLILTRKRGCRFRHGTCLRSDNKNVRWFTIVD